MHDSDDEYTELNDGKRNRWMDGLMSRASNTTPVPPLANLHLTPDT